MADSKQNTKLAVLLLFLITVLIIYDSKMHFDAELVELKKKRNSGQRNWSFYYPQYNVYQDSSIRYIKDLNTIDELMEDESVVLSDLASSYYLAAETSAYVKNIYGHHDTGQNINWSKMISKQNACFPDQPQRRAKFFEFVHQRNKQAKARDKPLLKYVLVNKDRVNRNLRRECLSVRHGSLNKHYSSILPTVFSGEFLNLYHLEAD